VKILKLDIPDISSCNLYESKVRLADKIVHGVLPYINNEMFERIKDLKKIKKEIRNRKKIVSAKKISLESTLKVLERKRKTSLLLDRAMKLVAVGGLNDENVKSELTVMLKIIDDLPEEKIDFYLSEMMRIVTRRFSIVEDN
jgi:hypothetical protein